MRKEKDMTTEKRKHLAAWFSIIFIFVTLASLFYIVKEENHKCTGGKEMIALGCDHGGYELKQEIIKYLEENNIEYKDFGCDSTDSTDYPIYAKRVAIAIGISITANKFKGIRAALCSDCFSAEATRLHNNANILAMGGRVVGPGLAVKIVDTFLNTPFSEEERHIRRIKQIEEDTDITDAYPEI